MRYAATVLAVNLFLCISSPAGDAAAGQVTLAEPAFSIANGKPQMRCKIVVADGTLLGAELLRFGVTSWKDDQGTDLGAKDPKAFYGDVTGMTMGTGADTVMQLTGKNKPAEGAKTMSIEGSIPFKIGLGLQEGVTKDVTLKVGTAFKVGPYTFKVAKIEPTKDLLGGDLVDGQLIGFTFDSPVQLADFNSFKEFAFVDAAGKEHPSSMKNFMGSFKKGGEHKVSLAVLPPKGPLNVRWAVFAKIAEVTVPLKHSGPIEKAP